MKFIYSIAMIMLFSPAVLAQHGETNNSGTKMQEGRKPFMMQIGSKIIYHLYVTDTVVNYTGKNVNAVAIT